MCANKIVVLMTSAASFRRHAMTSVAASHIHGVRMSVISLAREVSGGMAIHASGMTQDGNERREERPIAASRRCRRVGARRQCCCN